eukprot:331859-Pyramimonas_sp.AAC.1
MPGMFTFRDIVPRHSADKKTCSIMLTQTTTDVHSTMPPICQECTHFERDDDDPKGVREIAPASPYLKPRLAGRT